MGIRVIEYDSVDDFRKKAKEVTAACREKVTVAKPKEEVKELSPYAKGVLSVWEKADFGCQTAHVGEFFHLTVKQVTGEDVEFKAKKSSNWRDEDHSYPLWSVIVPLSNTTGHSYPVEKPLFVTRKNRAKPFSAYQVVKVTSGEEGNTFGGEWRYATDEEVEEYFDSFKKTLNGKDRVKSIDKTVVDRFVYGLQC